jgi:hypothetical protein
VEYPNGRANFFTAETLRENHNMPETASEDTLQLMTTRGDSQFNTTVYGMDDRFRGVWGTRSVLILQYPCVLSRAGKGSAQHRSLLRRTLYNDAAAVAAHNGWKADFRYT